MTPFHVNQSKVTSGYFIRAYLYHRLIGYGSVLNANGEVEMDAVIMSGADLKCGGVACVQNIRNPVTLARAVMEKVMM